MALRSSLTTPISLRSSLAIPVSPPPGAAPGPAASRVLTVPAIAQQGENWCWAACCEMILSYQGRAPIMQCDLAAAEFNQPAGSCCGNPPSDVCDQPAWPDKTYTRQQIPFQFVQTPLLFVTIQAKIDDPDGEPVEAYLEWTNGGAHVVLVTGWYTDTGLDEVEVHDPDPSNVHGGRILFAELEAAYSMGSWKSSYTFN